MASSSKKKAGAAKERPFIGVRWECCDAYTRVYRHVSGEFYLGRCPKCGKSVRLEVGAGGTNSRFFKAR